MQPAVNQDHGKESPRTTADPGASAAVPRSDLVKGRLRGIRLRLRAASLGDPAAPKDKKHRPAWVLRLACTTVDLGTVAIISSSILSFFSGDPPAGSDLTAAGERQALSDSLASLSLVVLVPSYYLFWEWFAGRTPGKMVMGFKMIATSGELSRGRMIWRGLARFIPLLQLLMMLSWRRVTLLDLITGTRVQSMPRPRTSLRSRSSSGPRPRGYDENLSTR